MNSLSNENMLLFYYFLNGDIELNAFEKFVYSESNLENQLGAELYTELISLDYKSKFPEVREFVSNKIIGKGRFETWKLIVALNSFLAEPEKLHFHLLKLYKLYCGILDEDNNRKFVYEFLQHLGLNYLYWVDETYLKLNYGDKWKQEYDRCFQDFDFYHQQLKPLAEDILLAFENKQIEILDDGNYNISAELKSRLEVSETYQLKHPDSKG